MSAKKTGGIALEKLTPIAHTKTNPPYNAQKKLTPCLERTTQRKFSTGFQHI